MRLAKALIRLRVCAGWSEPLLVAHTTLLEISSHGSYVYTKTMYLQYLCSQYVKVLLSFYDESILKYDNGMKNK